MKRALAVIFFLMSDSFVFSQNSVTIIGKVINEKSGEALPYATISIAHSSYGTVSNEYGEFELKVPFHLINDTLMISYLGFRLYKEKITAQTEYRVFKLEEASTVLDDVLVKDKKLTAEDILYKAIDKLLERSDLQDFRLEGFYREVHSANNRVIGLIEAAFSIYDNSCTHPMQNIEVEEFRKVVSEELSNVPSKQLYKHNNLMMLFGTSTNFVVLGRQGLKNGKTTWAIGKRPYTIESISSYNDRPVYVISHVNETTSLRIIIDADDFSVLRNEYHSKQSINDYKNYFWKYSGISESTCGFYETRQVYEYYEFQGMIYPRIFHRTDYSDRKSVV